MVVVVEMVKVAGNGEDLVGEGVQVGLEVGEGWGEREEGEGGAVD